MLNRLRALINGYNSSDKRYHKIIKKKIPLIELRIFSQNKKKKNKIFPRKNYEVKYFMPKWTIVCTPSNKIKNPTIT